MQTYTYAHIYTCYKWMHTHIHASTCTNTPIHTGVHTATRSCVCIRSVVWKMPIDDAKAVWQRRCILLTHPTERAAFLRNRAKKLACRFPGLHSSHIYLFRKHLDPWHYPSMLLCDLPMLNITPRKQKSFFYLYAGTQNKFYLPLLCPGLKTHFSYPPLINLIACAVHAACDFPKYLRTGILSIFAAPLGNASDF